MMFKIATVAAVAALATHPRADDPAAATASKTMHEAMQQQADMPMHAPAMPGGPATAAEMEHARHTGAAKSAAPADAKHQVSTGQMGRVDASHAQAANKAAMGAAMGGGPNGGAAGPRGPGMMGSSPTGSGMMGGSAGEMTPAMQQQMKDMHPGGMMDGSGGGMMPGGSTSPGGTMPGTTGASPGTGTMSGGSGAGTTPGGTTGGTSPSPTMPHR